MYVCEYTHHTHKRGKRQRQKDLKGYIPVHFKLLSVLIIRS